MSDKLSIQDVNRVASTIPRAWFAGLPDRILSSLEDLTIRYDTRKAPQWLREYALAVYSTMAAMDDDGKPPSDHPALLALRSLYDQGFIEALETRIGEEILSEEENEDSNGVVDHETFYHIDFGGGTVKEGSFTCWVRVDQAKDPIADGALPCSRCLDLTYPDYGGEVVGSGEAEDTWRQDVKLSGEADDTAVGGAEGSEAGTFALCLADPDEARATGEVPAVGKFTYYEYALLYTRHFPPSTPPAPPPPSPPPSPPPPSPPPSPPPPSPPPPSPPNLCFQLGFDILETANTASPNLNLDNGNSGTRLETYEYGTGQAYDSFEDCCQACHDERVNADVSRQKGSYFLNGGGTQALALALKGNGLSAGHRCVFFLLRPIENREVLGAEFLSYHHHHDLPASR